MRPDELLSFTTMTGDVVRAIRESPAPVIAAIQGTAAGAGSVLALASDFRVMARSAKFAFLFTKVGLAGADMGAAYLLPRLVGLGRATKLLMLGDRSPPSRPSDGAWSATSWTTTTWTRPRRRWPHGWPSGPGRATRRPSGC